MSANDLPIDALPWSPEAESSVLGSLLMDPAGYDFAGDLLLAKHFFDERHGRIWTSISALVLANKPVDAITVFDDLKATGQAADVSLGYLSSLATHALGGRTIRRHAEIVVDRAMARALMEAANDVRAIAETAETPVADRLEQAQARLQQLQMSKGRSEPQRIDTYVVSLLDRIQALADGDVQPGIPTRIPALDRMLGGGLRGGKQMILAARPSVGKSSLGEQICINVALDGHPAAMFSQEMGNEELSDRATANLGRIALDRMQTGKLEREEWTRLTEAVERMRDLPLFFDEQPALTLHDITAKARELKRKHGLKLLVIDYIQLCGSGKTGDSRHHQLEEISRGLKALARQLDITILTLSQLNREVEKRASGRPMLSDLKESGAIEEDADVVLMLWRHSTRADGIQLIGCDMPKNRQGRVGEFALQFEGGYQRWQETLEPLAPKQAAGGRRSYTEEA